MLPTLLKEEEAVEHLDITVEEFRKYKLKPAGTYFPPRAKGIALYASRDVQKIGRAHV
jgi:hypothetical protein